MQNNQAFNGERWFCIEASIQAGGARYTSRRQSMESSAIAPEARQKSRLRKRNSSVKVLKVGAGSESVMFAHEAAFETCSRRLYQSQN